MDFSNRDLLTAYVKAVVWWEVHVKSEHPENAKIIEKGIDRALNYLKTQGITDLSPEGLAKHSKGKKE